MQPFSIAVVDVFGVPVVHNLKENGDEIAVTNDTRQVTIHCSMLLCWVDDGRGYRGGSPTAVQD